MYGACSCPAKSRIACGTRSSTRGSAAISSRCPFVGSMRATSPIRAAGSSAPSSSSTRARPASRAGAPGGIPLCTTVVRACVPANVSQTTALTPTTRPQRAPTLRARRPSQLKSCFTQTTGGPPNREARTDTSAALTPFAWTTAGSSLRSRRRSRSADARIPVAWREVCRTATSRPSARRRSTYGPSSRQTMPATQAAGRFPSRRGRYRSSPPSFAPDETKTTRTGSIVRLLPALIRENVLMPVEPVRLVEQQLQAVTMELADHLLDPLARVPRHPVVAARVVVVGHEGDAVLGDGLLELGATALISRVVEAEVVERPAAVRGEEGDPARVQRAPEEVQEVTPRLRGEMRQHGDRVDEVVPAEIEGVEGRGGARGVNAELGGAEANPLVDHVGHPDLPGIDVVDQEAKDTPAAAAEVQPRPHVAVLPSAGAESLLDERDDVERLRAVLLDPRRGVVVEHEVVEMDPP